MAFKNGVNTDLITGHLVNYVNNNTKTNNGVGSFDFTLGNNKKGFIDNYLKKYSTDKYNLLNTSISAGADLAGNLINYNGLSTGVGNVMSGIGNIVGNIPGPVGWAGKGLALLGLGVNALWGHKFNDANVAAAESANRERNNWQFGDYSNTDALLAGSMANVLLGNVSKGFLGKEGPFSNAVTNKMNLINNDRMMANLRANNSELNAYNNYQINTIRNAIAGDNMGNVNAAASGGPLSMINGIMTPFGNRYFADGGYTHGGLFTNGFIEINNGGSHELNPNQGVLYGVDPQGTPNMVEEGETIFDDYVFSKRIKFPKKYKDEFALGGKIWKKSFADVSKMIAKESEERPNDPISQLSLQALGGKLANILEEVKAKQALDKMDPREVMAILLQMAAMQQGGEQPLMEQQLMMEDPYAQVGMEEAPIMQACGGKLHSYGGPLNTFDNGGYIGNPNIQLFNNVNLFKRGSKARIKGKSRAHKSDLDWERMYNASLPLYQKMVNAGVPENLALGVIANMAAESSFDPNATNGTHWGYVQNDKSLKGYNEKMYKGYGADLQLLFLIDGLTTGIKGANKGLGKLILKRFDNYKKAMEGVTDPELAAELWEKHYEISDGLGLYDRKNYARKFYDKRNPQVTLAVEQAAPQAVPQVLNQVLNNGYLSYEMLSDLVPQEVLNYANDFTPTSDFAINNEDYSEVLDNDLLAARKGGGKNKKNKVKTTTTTEATTTESDEPEVEEVKTNPASGNVTDYGFLKSMEGISHLQTLLDNTHFDNPKEVATLLAEFMSNKIISKDLAAGLFYNMLNNIFPGMKESGIKDSAKYWKNLLGTRLGGYSETTQKLDAKGKPVYKEVKNKKTGKVEKKPVMIKKNTPWVGPAYYKAMLENQLPSEFDLNRGFTGDYKNLSLKYNADTPESELDKVLRQYQSTDPLVLNSYYNAYEDELKKIWKDRYDAWKEAKKIYDTEDYKNWLAYRNGDTEVLSPEALSFIDDAARRVNGTLSRIEGVENEADREALLDMYTQDLYDLGYISDELLNPYYVASLDSDYDDLYSAEAVDPESEAFSELNPYQQQIAREKYYSDLAKNDKEGTKYFKQFEEEDKKEAERLKREEELRKSLEYTALPTWMRYAPLAFSSIATLSDALGLTNKADLTPYNQLIALSDKLNRTTPVRYHPVFQPLLYLPANLNYDLQQANNMYAATNRNISNATSGNIGAGIAGSVTALNSAGNNYDKIRRAAADLNLANMRTVAEYNNKGAYQDAAGSMEAQKINAVNTLNAQRFGYQALADALRYYQAEQQAANAAKQVNLTHAVNSWANVGRENMYMNMINSNKAWDYRISQDGSTFYKGLVNALNTLNG